MRSRHSLRAWTQALLPEGGRPSQVAAWVLVRSLLVDFQAQRTQLARQADRSSTVKATRQFFSRWLTRGHWEPDALYTHLNRLTRRVLQKLRQREEVVLLVDLTDLAKQWRVLQVSVEWQRRALPLYRRVVHAKGPEQGLTEMVVEVCEWLKAELPGPFSRYVLVLDRGFPCHALVRAWQQLGFRFVVRAEGTWKMTHADFTGRLREAAEHPDLLGPTPRLFRDAVLGRPSKGLKSRIHWSESHVVFYHGEGYQQPWFLLTRETSAADAVRLYRLRMRIEAQFRDLKGPWGLDRIERWQSREAVARFLAWVAVYEWRLAYLWSVHELARWAEQRRVFGTISWITTARDWVQCQLRQNRLAAACL